MSPLEEKLRALQAADFARKERWKKELIIPSVSLIKDLSNELLVFELLDWCEKAIHLPEGVHQLLEWEKQTDWSKKALRYKAALFEECVRRMKKE